MTLDNDLIDNPSARCPVALVLDTSGSMSGAPIAELNAGAQLFIEELKRDDLARWSVELAVYTAGGSADRILEFTCVEEIAGIAPMSAGGSTPLGAATRMALNDLDVRKNQYRHAGVPYYQPWLVIISDGAPTDEWQDVANLARELSANRKLVSMPIGVQGADLQILGQFSSKRPLALDGLKFRDFFAWLSASL
ncbi:MAG: VWA domain-containing protein, partial [Acidithiobacillus sp.]|nr:VWA domain-containing protein [Acidithiobacillus sp.]